MENCSCDRNNRMRSLVISLVERLQTEEMMRRKSDQEMEMIMIKLETLQKNLTSEQVRLKTMLQNKDNVIR